MEWSLTAVLFSCLYLSLLTAPVSAKCRGKWRIHACFGGNGKRSDPSQEPSLERASILLDKLLARDTQGLNDFLEPEPMDVTGFEESYDPRPRLQYTETRDRLAQLRNFMRELRMRKKTRQDESELV